jgi:hypothetical protein
MASRLLQRELDGLRISQNLTINQKEKNIMADEKLRVTTFDVVALDDNDWDGPHPQGELLTYKSKHAAASIKVTRGSTVVFDRDYDGGKTLIIDGNVIHLPEGAKGEI